MSLFTVAGMNGSKDHRGVEQLRGRCARGRFPRTEVPRVGDPIAVEYPQDRLCLGAERGGFVRLAAGPQPLGAFVERRRRDAQREVVRPELLFPDVERGFAPVPRVGIDGVARHGQQVVAAQVLHELRQHLEPPVRQLEERAPV